MANEVKYIGDHGQTIEVFLAHEAVVIEIEEDTCIVGITIPLNELKGMVDKLNEGLVAIRKTRKLAPQDECCAEGCVRFLR